MISTHLLPSLFVTIYDLCNLYPIIRLSGWTLPGELMMSNPDACTMLFSQIYEEAIPCYFDTLCQWFEYEDLR